MSSVIKINLKYTKYELQLFLSTKYFEMSTTSMFIWSATRHGQSRRTARCVSRSETRSGAAHLSLRLPIVSNSRRQFIRLFPTIGNNQC